MTKKVKNNTHCVIKWEWLEENLTNEELETFYGLLDKASENKPEYKYIVCNADEPYAQRVHDIILSNEPAISKDQVIKGLIECSSLKHDPELAHVEADELIMKYVNDKEIEAVWEQVPKQYA